MGSGSVKAVREYLATPDLALRLVEPLDPASFALLSARRPEIEVALADLDSLVRTAERATVIVYNDAAYTAEITQYGMQGLDERPMRIDQVSFAGLAQAVGARGTEVRTLTDLDEWAAWAASGERGTWVLDCRVSGEIIAPYQLEIMENLKRQNAQAR